jgi:hypothetical protein
MGQDMMHWIAAEQEQHRKAELEQARGAIRELEQKLEQIERACEFAHRQRQRLIDLLASGQCVDLAIVQDYDLGEDFAYGGTSEERGKSLRAWLLERAKVKL